jgi:hypothetical protein
MKRIVLITFMIVLLATLFAQAESGTATTLSRNDYKPMVVVNNQYSEDVSLMIGDEYEEVYYIYDLAETEVSVLTPVNYTGTYTVYYMFPDDDDWVEWQQTDSEDPFTVTLTNGNVLSLLVTPEGGIQSLTLDFKPTAAGKVMFFNLSGDKLPVMEVGKEFGDRDIVFCEDMGVYAASDFGDVPAGSYCLFWQTPNQDGTDKFFYFPDDNMNYKLKDFSDNNWYQMMVYKNAGEYYCVYNNITPTKSFLKTE